MNKKFSFFFPTSRCENTRRDLIFFFVIFHLRNERVAGTFLFFFRSEKIFEITSTKILIKAVVESIR